MDQATCRNKLGHLITDESLALPELSALLDREHGFLEANDVVALEGASRERQELADSPMPLEIAVRPLPKMSFRVKLQATALLSRSITTRLAAQGFSGWAAGGGGCSALAGVARSGL